MMQVQNGSHTIIIIAKLAINEHSGLCGLRDSRKYVKTDIKNIKKYIKVTLNST